MDANDRLREVNGRVEKRCTVCEEWKSIPSEFSLRPTTADGFKNRCRKCDSDQKRQNYSALTDAEKRRRMDRSNEKKGNRRAAVRNWLRGA